jgi:regulator of chromosome condensation
MHVTLLAQAGETIISVACGDGQTFAVATSGNVWGWGCYKDKEGKAWFDPAPTGQPNIKRKQSEPMQLPFFNEQCAAVEVCCGGVYNIVRCEDGRMFSWGLGECGELSREVPPLKDSSGDYDKAGMIKHSLTPGPMMIKQPGGSLVEAKNPKSIGCGAYHALVVMGSSVYACGLNNYGQLGTGDTDSRDFLVQIATLEGRNVVCVRGGMHHSLALTGSGTVLAFGRADSGQLGIARLMGKSAGEFLTLPEEVCIESSSGEGVEVRAIACGSNHNLVVRRGSSDVYSWGYGDMLALGHGKEQDEFKPKKINFAKSASVERGSSVGQIVQVSRVCFPACLLVCLLACLPACLSACLLVCLPACLPVWMCLSVSECVYACLSWLLTC